MVSKDVKDAQASLVIEEVHIKTRIFSPFIQVKDWYYLMLARVHGNSHSSIRL